jgi:hypothetical protein
METIYSRLKSCSPITRKFVKALVGMGSFEVILYDEGCNRCRKFKIASEKGHTHLLDARGPEKTLPSLVDSDSALDILELFVNSQGYWDRAKFQSVSPRQTNRSLIYSELTEENAKSFCFDATNIIAENLILALTPEESSFLTVKLDELIQNLRVISGQKNLASAIGLALLVHASKSGSPKVLQSCALILAVEGLTIESAPPIFERASELLDKKHIQDILLYGTDLDTSALEQLKTVFVSFPKLTLRGWCGPSLVVINLHALKDSYHLDNPVPMFALNGLERRHAILRKWCWDDLNLSSPTKPELVGHAEISELKHSRESGLWFELAAIGEKFSFDKENRTLTEALMQAILEGVNAGKVPALCAAQLEKFRMLAAEHNQDSGFDHFIRDTME